MLGIGFAPARIPEMVGDEFEQQRFRRRPGEGRICRGQRPGLQVGEIRGERPKRVFAHALVDEMAQRLDILVSQ
jgi:hypothetical protein